MAVIPTEYHFPLRVVVEMVSSVKVQCQPIPAPDVVGLSFRVPPSPDVEKMQAALQELTDWAAKHKDVVVHMEAAVRP